MWLFTPFGFFSIVAKEPGDVLAVRARFREDLDRLREGYLPTMTPTVSRGGSDYPYRAFVERSQFQRALRRIVEGLTYDNFKSEVGRTLGKDRKRLYQAVWRVMKYGSRPVRRPGPRTLTVKI